MRFEKSIEIDAPQQRVWDVLSDIEAWPRRIETVDTVEFLTPPPLSMGGRVRLTQPKLPVGVWEVTNWEAPASFEWIRSSGGMTTVAGHGVEPLGEGRSRLTLTLEMRGWLAPVVGRLYRNLTNRYLALEAAGMKRAAEST